MRLLALLALSACGAPTSSQPTPPANPFVSGQVTLDESITAQAGADLWVGAFTDEMLDGLGAPIDATQPVFGQLYTAVTFPVDYNLDPAQVGTFVLWVGLDNDNDALFCDGDAVGRYSILDSNGDNQAVPIELGPFGLGQIDVVVDLALFDPFVSAACP